MSDHHPIKHTPIFSKSSKRSLEILSESLEVSQKHLQYLSLRAERSNLIQYLLPVNHK